MSPEETIEAYLRREPVRPATTWVTPAVILVLMVLLPPAVGYGTMELLGIAGGFWWYAGCSLVVGLPLFRLLLIKLVRCYQHYAPMRLRRFCMCVPSCSEYAVAVLKKDLLAVAIYKIIYRLTVTCDGEKKLDLP